MMSLYGRKATCSSNSPFRGLWPGVSSCGGRRLVSFILGKEDQKMRRLPRSAIALAMFAQLAMLSTLVGCASYQVRFDEEIRADDSYKTSLVITESIGPWTKSVLNGSASVVTDASGESRIKLGRAAETDTTETPGNLIKQIIDSLTEFGRLMKGPVPAP